MSKIDVKKMDIYHTEESLMHHTRTYMRMLGGSVPSDETQRENCLATIKALALNIAEWADAYPSLFSSEDSEK